LEERNFRRDGGRVATDALGNLQDLLKELFQFENADLDFGIYRIMNHKRAEIRRFLDEGLPGIVEEALQGGAAARQPGSRPRPKSCGRRRIASRKPSASTL
jgi:hypothetical protein